MSEITQRIREHLVALQRSTLSYCDDAVIYLGRKEFYDLLIAMRDDHSILLDYPNEVRRVLCFGLEVIEVQKPQYLRVA